LPLSILILQCSQCVVRRLPATISQTAKVDNYSEAARPKLRNAKFNFQVPVMLSACSFIFSASLRVVLRGTRSKGDQFEEQSSRGSGEHHCDCTMELSRTLHSDTPPVAVSGDTHGCGNEMMTSAFCDICRSFARLWPAPSLVASCCWECPGCAYPVSEAPTRVQQLTTALPVPKTSKDSSSGKWFGFGQRKPFLRAYCFTMPHWFCEVRSAA
jgi:hypothetical protein